MKEWLELNITINGFQYAVREEVTNLKDIEQKGIQLSFRLQELINKRETTTNQCKIKPGADYITLNNKGKFLSNKLPQEWEDEIFEYEQHSENYLKLKSQTLKSILVRKEDIIPVSNKCKIKPGAEYFLAGSLTKQKYIFQHSDKEVIFILNKAIDSNFYLLRNYEWYDLLVRKEDIIPL